MFRHARYSPEYDVVPQAIFARPLNYFCSYDLIRSESDHFDSFIAAHYTKGNQIDFDLRTYSGHPKHTSSVYLPFETDDDEIEPIISEIIAAFALPRHALLWKRGGSLDKAELTRPQSDRLTESEARMIALKVASEHGNMTATTTSIIENAPRFYQLSESDLARSKTRSGERLWQQRIRNIISHQQSSVSLFQTGKAIRTSDGIKVTKIGRHYLNSIGFISSGAVMG